MTSGDSKQTDYPFPLTDLDREILAQTDEEYVPHDWEDLKSLVGRE